MAGKPRLITVNGETLSVAAWARRVGTSERKITYRLARGMSPEEAVEPEPLPIPGRFKFSDLTGQRFGRLVVVAFSGTVSRSRTWVCKCDCGTEVVVPFKYLSGRQKISCGCARVGPQPHRKAPNRLRPGESSFNQLFSQYKRSATARGLAFELTRDQFKQLTRQPCFYCAAFPEGRGPAVKGTLGTYLYSGVDRVNNDEGYVLWNVRSCCKICNVAKASMTESEFFSWVGRVYSRIWEVLEDRGEFSGQQAQSINETQWRPPA